MSKRHLYVLAFAIVGIPAVIAGLSMFLKGRLAPQPVARARSRRW